MQFLQCLYVYLYSFIELCSCYNSHCSRHSTEDPCNLDPNANSQHIESAISWAKWGVLRRRQPEEPRTKTRKGAGSRSSDLFSQTFPQKFSLSPAKLVISPPIQTISAFLPACPHAHSCYTYTSNPHRPHPSISQI